MVRLHLIVEGQTEETFVKRILAPHLAGFNVMVDARRVQTGRDRAKNRVFRGGLVNYAKLRNDLLCWIKQDRHPEVCFSTMIDLYALPNDFPSFETALAEDDAREKIAVLEGALKNDILAGSGQERFIPYIQLHEYEALLLTKPDAITTAVGSASQVQGLKNDIAGEQDVELINERPDKAPSKRIIKYIPEYEDQKSSAGPIIAETIGLEHLRSNCSHFNEWLTELESLDGC